MKNQQLIHPHFIAIGIPILLLASAILLTLNLAVLTTHEKVMFSALTIDLVLTVPVVYFLLIRKKSISKFTIVPFFIIGIIIATLIIPESHQHTLGLLKTYLLPVVEITVLTLVILKIRNAIKIYRINSKGGNLDFITALGETTKSLFPPRIAAAVRTEIGLLYFGFFSWKKPKYAANEFTYHKENSMLLLLGTLLAVALIELFAVHLLLHEWNPTVTWILSIVSAYGVLQIFGLMKAVPRTPIQLTTTHLILRMGVFQETKIPLEKIERLEFTFADYDKEDKDLQKIGLFDHNSILHLNSTAKLHGLFGSTKNYTRLAFSIDDKEKFKQALTTACTKQL